MSLSAALRERRVIICCGAGGVGKTTVSAALALAGARLGRRVLVITIDPSKRLAEALGVSRNAPEPVELSPERLAVLGVSPPGTLSAWMLDPVEVSDRTVRAFARHPDEAGRLLDNPFYQGITRIAAGMQEYTAVEALYTFVQAGTYDLVVLDTPPSRNALRFLDTPERAAAFLDPRIFALFSPTDGKGWVRRMAGNVVEKVLDVAFGVETRNSIQEFFGLFGQLLHHLNANQAALKAFLRSDAVGFVLVTSPERAALEEAAAFEHRARERLNMPILGRVLNQSLAADPPGPDPETLAGEPAAREHPEALAALRHLAALEQRVAASHAEVARTLIEATHGPVWVLPKLGDAMRAQDPLAALGPLAERLMLR